MGNNLARCEDCNGLVSRSASVCPHCGRPFGPIQPPRRKTHPITWIIGGIFAIAVFSGVIEQYQRQQTEDRRVQLLTPEQRTAEDRAKAASTARLTAARAAATALKQSLRDPASVQWESILVSDDAKTVCVAYRARNGFGGLNREIAVYHNGKPSQSISSWNTWCAGKQLYNASAAAP